MFRYRLDALLRYRKSVEEERQRTLAEANRAYLSKQGEGDSAQSSKQAAIASMKEQVATLDKSELFELYYRYIAGVNADIMMANIETQHAHNLMKIEQEKLAEAVKQRRIIELHRDRQKEAYDREELRKERITEDEIATTRYKREERTHA